jgi:tetratricopeptide (TPR) repeat protein
MGIFDFFKKKKPAVDDQLFYSQQYQTEMLAYAQTVYFQKKQSYDAVKSELSNQGLSNAKVAELIEKLKGLNATMVTDFQNKIDSGEIIDIKIKPNDEHVKGEVDADQVDKYIGYGAYQLERGDFDNALELFDKALELDNKATLAYVNKGMLYANKGDNKKAIEFYNKALELEPENVKVLENKMDLLFEDINQSGEAEFIDTVKNILTYDPDSPNALIYIIQFYLKGGDLTNALNSLKRLFANHYSEGIVIQLLLDTFSTLTKQEALNEFELLKQQIKPEAQYQLEYCKGLYLKGIRDRQSAFEVFDNLNKIQPFSWNYYQMAIISNLENRTTECLQLLNKTFELEPQLKVDAKQYLELQNLWENEEFIVLTK